MLELSPLLSELSPLLGTNVRIFSEIIKGIYCVSSGGVTMKNIARWTGKGGSYRNIQRLMGQNIAWLELNILLFQMVYIATLDPKHYILAFDEVVEDKAGKQTHGVNWFYSSIAGRVIRSISNHVVSIIDTKKATSMPLTHHQTVKEDKKSGGKKSESKKKKGRKSKSSNKKAKRVANNHGAERKAGRPNGSKNKQNVKSEGLLYSSFEGLLKLVLPILRNIVGLCIRYVVADGAYGNKTCCLISRENGLDLISKLNRNTGLWLPFRGEYSGKGRRKKYGDKIDYQKLGTQDLVSKETEDGVMTKTYQMKGVWTKRMPYLINVVIIVKIDLKEKKEARVILFSTDVELDWTEIIRFYSLRFQIEFNFRDAKQYFGMSDFKNTKEQQVYNAVGLSLFMDNVSLILIEQAKEEWEEENISVQDLKAYYRAQKYLEDILNTLEIPQNTILNEEKFADILKIGAINRTKKRTMPS